MSDVNYELLRVTMGDSDEIRYIDFIEDVVPKYLFMIVNNRDTKQSNLFIKLIKKNPEYFEKAAEAKIPQDESVKYEKDQPLVVSRD